MGEYDFLGGFDFGDMGGLAGGGTQGGNIPNLGGFNISLPEIPQSSPFLGGLGSAPMPSIPSTPTPTPQFAPAPTPQFQDAGGGQSGGWLGSILGQGTPGGGILKDITGLAGVGLQGLGIKNQIDALHMAKGQSRQTNAMQEVQRKSAQPLQQFGTQQLQQAAAGHIDPSAQALIDQWVQAQKAAMMQRLSSMGITNSTMAQSAMAQIDQQAIAMKNSVLGQDKNTAINALSQAMQGATMGAGTANQEQVQLDNLIAQANKAMAQLTSAAA